MLGAGDVGIKVGHASSVAEFRVATPEDLVAALVVLAELLRA